MGGITKHDDVRLGKTMALIPGHQAPNFILRDQYGIAHQLSHYLGTWVILCFLPSDYNAACVKEVCSIRDDFFNIQDRQAELFAINLDGRHTHARFAARYNLSFPLLSDRTGSVCEQYEALWSWGPLRLVRRHSIMINPTGSVVRIYRRVIPNQHSKQLIRDLDLLQQTFMPTQNTTTA